MTNASNVAAVGALIYHNPALFPVLVEHLEDNNGQVLPHLLMGDVMRWLAAHWESDTHQCQGVLAWLDEAYESGSEEVQELIVQSGVENIPGPGLPGSAMRGALGDRLRAWDPWLT